MVKTVLFRTYKNDERAFPFDKTWAVGLLPVANQPNVLRTIQLMKQMTKDLEFRILVDDRVEDYRYYLQNESISFFDSLVDALQGVSNLLIIDVDYYFDFETLKWLLHTTDNTILVQEKSEQYKAIHGMGVKVEGQQVIKIIGHGRDHYVDYMMAGAMMLNSEVLDLVMITPLGMEDVVSGGMPLQKLYLENVVSQAISKEISIKYHLLESPILNIAYPWHLLEANQKEASRTFETNYSKEQVDDSSVVLGPLSMGEGSSIQYNCVVKGNVRIGKNTKIAHGVIIDENVIIGDNCTINHYAYITKNTVIGNGVKLGYHSEVGGLIMDGAAIVHQCEMYGVVGRKVDIGAGTLFGILRFDDQQTMIKVGGLRMANQSTSYAFIGDYSRTGVGNLILPGVRIGSYCAIAPGAIVDADIKHETLVLVEQEKQYKSWTPAKYNWK